MVQKLGLLLLAFVALVAVGGLIIQIQSSTTGNFVKSGGGRWYYGPMRAQLEPDEACTSAGLQPVYPMEVYRNDYGTALSLCRQGDRLVGVPVVQTIYSQP